MTTERPDEPQSGAAAVAEAIRTSLAEDRAEAAKRAKKDAEAAELAEEKRKRKADADAAIEAAVLRINKDHALVCVGDRVMILKEGQDDEGRPEIGFKAPHAFKTWFCNEPYWTGRADVGIGDLWLAHPLRRQYLGVTFSPAGAPEGWYNLWHGFDVEPVAGDPAKAFPTFYDHLWTNLAGADEARFRWIIGWFAQMVQRPTERLGTAMVLRGKMGTGKTKVGEVFGSLISRHYLLVDDPRYIVGQFNAHQAYCLLLQADEAFWAGDKQAESRLKGLITSARHMVERKGIDPVPVRNLVHLLVTSNSDWVVPAGFEERRFAVFDVADHAMQNAAYFGAIDDEMDNGGRSVLLHWLLNFDLSTVNLRQVPMTEALVDQKVASMSAEAAWWYDRLRYGAPTSRHHDWPDLVRNDLLYADYLAYAERLGIRRRLSDKQLGMSLRKVTPPTVKRTKRMVRIEEHGAAGADQATPVWRRLWCLELPELATCREFFETAIGGKHDWGEDSPAEGSP